MMKKLMKFTALALALTLCVGTAAYAWHGQDEHANSQYHKNAEHSKSGAKTWQHGQGSSCFQHGGGHDSAHAQQQGQNLSFYQHGGGHEWAQNNSAIHEAEKQDPKHSENLGHK
jgi:uncharacterized membrane protein